MEHHEKITTKSDLPTMQNPWYVLRFLAIIAACWLPVLIDNKAVQSVTALYQLPYPVNPYFIPQHTVRLYLWTPLVVMSAFFLFLSPGMFLSIAFNKARGVCQWICTSLLLSIVVISVVTGIVQSVIEGPLLDRKFAALIVGISLVCFGVIFLRIVLGHQLRWPFFKTHNGATIVSILVATFLFLIILTPKLYWDNFNGDGAHAFGSARLLLVQPLPFWPSSAGGISSFPGITNSLFTFPASWFIRLFGEVEASARLPFLLYLVGLYGVVVSLIEQGRNTSVGRAGLWLIWLGLAVYTVVMVFSATYNPYNADIAGLATGDTLQMVCFLGFILGFLRREYYWMFFCLTLTYLSSPGGPMLVGLWLLAVIVVWKQKPWRQVVIAIATVIGCKMIATVAPGILAAINLPTPGGEHSLFQVLKKFVFLQLTDWHRIVFLVVPSGILPALSLVLWKRQDKISRTLTVVTAAYFGVFYIQAYYSHHYFVPVMILPLIIFWRYDFMLNPRHRIIKFSCYGVTGIIALIISLPENINPHTTARIVGEAIDDRIGGYDSFNPESFRKSHAILNHLFPYASDPSVPHKSYGGSPLQWYYYANRNDGVRNVNYVIQPVDFSPPVGMRLIAREDDVALFLRSDHVWKDHRELRPHTPAESKIYFIRRDLLFLGSPVREGPHIFDMRVFLGWLGLMDMISDKFNLSEKERDYSKGRNVK